MANMWRQSGELTGRYLELYDLLADTEVELDEDMIKDTFEALEGEMEVIADKGAMILDQLDADEENLKRIEYRLAEKRHIIDNRRKSVKMCLENMMRATGRTKFKTNLFSFGIQKNPPSVKLLEGITWEQVPAEYLKFKNPDIDTNRIKEDLKQGVALEFATLVQGESLRIR